MIESVSRALRIGRRKLGTARDELVRRTPAARARNRRTMALREHALPLLDDLSRNTDRGAALWPAYERILVDGMWDNANYWLRYAMVRAALGLAGAQETGLTGRYNRDRVRHAFGQFGIADFIDFTAYTASRRPHLKEARGLLQTVRTPDDMLALKLPNAFPASVVYDGILSRQLVGKINVADPMLVDHVAEALGCIHGAEGLFEEHAFDLVVLSHAVNFDFTSIAWSAMRRGIPVVVLYGDLGTARFIRITRLEDINDYINRPSPEEFDSCDEAWRDRLAAAGAEYMDRRLNGRTLDIGAAYAYQRRTGDIDRESLCARFNWDPGKPVVAVYASNWFDYPHSAPMSHFRDFMDWIEVTIDVAKSAEHVNWLFKAHPCDDWYPASNGKTLAELVREANRPHICLVPKAWNGLALMQTIDAGITFFGTVGIELSCLGKPVLVADRGWYGDLGFVTWPGTRQGYLEALKTAWWSDHDSGATLRRAREFAGWYFNPPDLAEDYIFLDDSEQDRIYTDLPRFLGENREAVMAEIACIRRWMDSDHRFYQTFKTVRAMQNVDAQTKELERSALP